MKKLWLDMDGVIADFTGGVCNNFNIPFSLESYSCTLPLGLWNYTKYLEDKYGLLWTDVEDKGSCSDFWENLPLLPAAKEFYETLVFHFSHFEVQFLTTPTGNYNSVFDGKRAWLEKHGFAARGDGRMTLIPQGASKERYAAPGIILIDDQDKNVQAFRHGGGYGILVPRPWNNRHREFKSFKQANDLVLSELFDSF